MHPHAHTKGGSTYQSTYPHSRQTRQSRKQGSPAVSNRPRVSCASAKATPGILCTRKRNRSVCVCVCVYTHPIHTRVSQPTDKSQPKAEKTRGKQPTSTDMPPCAHTNSRWRGLPPRASTRVCTRVCVSVVVPTANRRRGQSQKQRNSRVSKATGTDHPVLLVHKQLQQRAYAQPTDRQTSQAICKEIPWESNQQVWILFPMCIYQAIDMPADPYTYIAECLCTRPTHKQKPSAETLLVLK